MGFYVKQTFFYIEPTHSVQYNLIVYTLHVTIYELNETKRIIICDRYL